MNVSRVKYALYPVNITVNLAVFSAFHSKPRTKNALINTSITKISESGRITWKTKPELKNRTIGLRVSGQP